MLLNNFEYKLMNNPVRAAIQRHFESRQLLRMRGPMNGGIGLEIGCGRGIGIELMLDRFGADAAHGFDFDPRMITTAQRRLAKRTDRIRLWVGDATHIDAPNATYDAVFDFGVLHHVPNWQSALAEIARVLKPGGRLYGEEILAGLLAKAIVRRFLVHPTKNRFDGEDFRSALT